METVGIQSSKPSILNPGPTALNRKHTSLNTEHSTLNRTPKQTAVRQVVAYGSELKAEGSRHGFRLYSIESRVSESEFRVSCQAAVRRGVHGDRWHSMLEYADCKHHQCPPPPPFNPQPSTPNPESLTFDLLLFFVTFPYIWGM
jgi:hypothetical protein